MAPADDVCDATGKVCYSMPEARKRAKTQRRRHKEIVTEYHCASCGWWHYGNDVRRRRK